MGRRHMNWKQETASDEHGSRKYRGPPADSRGPPRPYSREKVFVGAYEKHDGTRVRGHFRKAPHRHLF
jgi:hypothetical protein